MRAARSIGRAGVVLLSLGAMIACADDPVTADQRQSLAEVGGETSAHSDDDSDGGPISILDSCDPRDAGWAPTGGCVLRRGDVTLAEFNALLASPHSTAVVGHPAWRNDPSHVLTRSGKKVRVRNEGGRLHTFTRVAAFGGGRVPPLNQGLTPAPECQLAPGAADPFAVAPGQRIELASLADGLHRFQCCIHPWMRATIRVEDHGRH
jgi:plastocyanin